MNDDAYLPLLSEKIKSSKQLMGELIYNIWEENIKGVASILKASPSIATYRDTNGDTPLHYAARRGNESMVKKLLKAGAIIDVLNNQEATPLSIAVMNSKERIVDILLQKKANPNLANKIGWTPTHTAIYAGNEKILKKIIDAGGYSEAPLFNTEQICIQECLNKLSRLFFKEIKDKTDLTIPQIDIKLMLIDFLIKQGFCLKGVKSPTCDFSKWIDAIALGTSCDISEEIDAVLTKLFIEFYYNLGVHKKSQTMQNWIICMCRAIESLTKINIKPLLYYALLESGEATISQYRQEYTLSQWMELAGINEKLILLINRIRNKKNPENTSNFTGIDIEKLMRVNNAGEVLTLKKAKVKKREIKELAQKLANDSIAQKIKSLLEWQPKDWGRLNEKLLALGMQNFAQEIYE